MLLRAAEARLDIQSMVIAFVAVCLALVVVSVSLFRRSGTRRPFVASGLLAGLAASSVCAAVVVALGVGRGTWNSWVAGTPEREGVTLGVLLIGLPVLLVCAVVALVIGGLRNRRHP